MRRVEANKVMAKTDTAKKVPAKKVPANKVTAKRVPANKVTAKRVPANEVTAKRVPAKKVTAKQVTAGEANVDGTHAIESNAKIFRDLMLGFVRIHLLYHASMEPIYGSGISAELASHGYRLSWGTLYPLLHSLEAEGLLDREDLVVEGKVRKYYSTTPLGTVALEEARRRALELVEEITGS